MPPKPAARQFSKTNPCSKIDIFNCFRSERGADWRPRLVVDTHALLGRNVPYRMVSDGRLEKYEQGNAEWYRLTDKGEKWVYEATLRYVRKDPFRMGGIVNRPRGWISR